MVAIDVQNRVWAVRERITQAARKVGRSAEEVTIVAVTKTATPQAIRQAAEVGITHFGENRVHNARQKLMDLPDVRARSTWHFIGHLQTNKVKEALDLFQVIQSVDSLHLAEAISRRAQGPVPVFLEVNITGEVGRLGFTADDLTAALMKMESFSNLDVQGLMAIAPLAAQAEEARPFFRRLRQLKDALGLRHLSMGMTNDFEIAIEEGATVVRIGRAIFGE